MGELVLPIATKRDNTLPPEVKYTTTDNMPYLAFDGSTLIEKIYWRFRMPATYGTSPLLKIHWSNSVSSTGNCIWQLQVWKVTPNSDGDDGAGAATYASANTVTDAGVGTRQVQEASMTLSNMDGAVAGDRVLFKFFRDPAGSDTMSEDAYLYEVTFTWTDA